MTTEKKSPYIEIFEKGAFRADKIKVEVVKSSREVPDKLQTILDQRWDNYSGKKWPGDILPSRFRYEGSKVVDGVLLLRVAPVVSYKDHITWDHELTENYGIESAPLPISATTIIKTSDRKLIITNRNLRTDYKPGGFSGTGGFITIKDDCQSDGKPDVVSALGREVEEESGLKMHETESTLQGIIYNPVSGAIALSFISTTKLASYKIKEREHDNENTLLFVDINPDRLQDLILRRTNAFTPEILELLILIGGEKFGSRWIDETIAIFKLREISYMKAIKMGPQVVKKLEERDINKR